MVVDLKPIKKLKNPVTLKEMKEEPELENLSLIRQGRLSVCSVTAQEFKLIVKMGS